MLLIDTVLGVKICELFASYIVAGGSSQTHWTCWRDQCAGKFIFLTFDGFEIQTLSLHVWF